MRFVKTNQRSVYMEFWFSERHTDNVELSIRVENSYSAVRVIFSELMFLILWSLADFLLQTVM